MTTSSVCIIWNHFNQKNWDWNYRKHEGDFFSAEQLRYVYPLFLFCVHFVRMIKKDGPTHCLEMPLISNNCFRRFLSLKYYMKLDSISCCNITWRTRINSAIVKWFGVECHSITIFAETNIIITLILLRMDAIVNH